MICADIDGTLVTNDNVMLKSTARTLKAASDKGIHIVLVSGRPPSGIFYLLDEAGIDGYVIAFGGAIVKKRGEIAAYEETIPMEDIAEIRLASLAFGMNLSIYRGEEHYVEEIDDRVIKEAGIGRTSPIVEPFSVISRHLDAANKLLYLADPAALVEFEERIAPRFSGRLNIYRSKPDYLEVCPPRSTKSNAIRRLSELFGVGMDEVMAVGDNYNDADMLSCAAISVAMGNAPDDIKKLCGHVTSSNEEDGLGEAVRRFVL